MSNPVKELFEGGNTYYYEDKKVSTTRKDKHCNLCNSLIPKGSYHGGAIIFRDEYSQIVICSDCETKYAKEIKEMRDQKYDN